MCKNRASVFLDWNQTSCRIAIYLFLTLEIVHDIIRGELINVSFLRILIDLIWDDYY